MLNNRRCVVLVVAALLILCAPGCAKRDGSAGGKGRSGSVSGTDGVVLGDVLEEVREDFTCGGSPIHPALVYEFIPWLSDRGPITVAVDLLSAQESNKYFNCIVKTRAGLTECDVRALGPDRDQEQTFGYRRLGVLADGTQVLKTYYWGGGSGIFPDVVLIRFEPEKTLDDEGRPCTRLLMKALCVFPLGDRDDAEVRVLSDRVIVGRSKYRDKEVVLKLK